MSPPNETELGAWPREKTRPAPPPVAAPPTLQVPKISLDGAPLSQASTHADEYGPESHPASPFYSHPTTKTSIEQLKTASSGRFSHYDTDVEAGSSPRPSGERTPDAAAARTATRGTARPGLARVDSMWPQRATLVAAHKQRKRTRGCYPWNQMTRKQKLIAKIAIALLVVGIGVVIGVCVSIAVGGTYYKSDTENSPVAPPKASGA